MDERVEKNGPVSVDTAPSRVTAWIFFLLLAVPAIGVVLFGAVDQITWSLFYLIWIVIAVLWMIDAWRRGGLLFNASGLLLPVAGLSVIGLIQLLPIAG